jgi:hypothetical protein
MNPDLLCSGNHRLVSVFRAPQACASSDPKRFSDADPRIATRTERDVANGWAYRLSSRERRP